jgi:multiple sugar transport system permease protein
MAEGQVQKRSRRKLIEAITAYCFIIPDFLGLVIFVIIPIVYAIVISFYQWDLISDKIFIGLDNYLRMFKDADWWMSLGRTLKLTLIYVPSLFAISLFLAVLVNSIKSRIDSAIKTAILLPFAITSVIASTLWMFLYNEKRGYINGFLNLVGIPNQPFLGSQGQALVSIIIVLLWINIGYNTILFLSAIKEVPASYYESAMIDGANRWEVFRYIMFPLIKQTSIFILITTTIASFQVMDLIMVMTKGGPFKATEVGVLYIFDKSFNMLDMGYGSTLSIALFVILFVLSFIQSKAVTEN